MKKIMLAMALAGSMFVVGCVFEQHYSFISRVKVLVSSDYAAAQHDARTVTREDFGRRISPINCPKNPVVIMTVGQSNAANYVSERFSGRGTIFYRGRCYPARDPLLGATGDRGSIWSRLSNKLPRDVLFLGIAVGSSSMESWSRGGILNDRIITAFHDLRNSGFTPKFILVQQGEYEGVSRANPDAYRTSAIALLKQLQGSGATVIFATSSTCGEDRNDAIRQAQYDARRATLAIAGPDMDSFFTYRTNICHLTGEGADKVAAEWAKILSEQR